MGFPSIAVLTIAALASAAPGAAAQVNSQTKTIEVCSGRAPFKVATVAGDKMVVSAGASPLDALRNRCLPQPYDFVSEDIRELLSGMKLAKSQSDSLAGIRKSFTVLQKTVNDQTLAAFKAKRDSTPNAPTPARASEPREVFLTDQMQTLREHLALAIRGIVTTEQIPRFEENLADHRKKDSKSK